MCGGEFGRARRHLLPKATSLDAHTMEACQVCVKRDEYSPVRSDSVYAIDYRQRCVDRRMREHRRAMRKQSRDPNAKRLLPGKGLPTSEWSGNALVLIPSIGAAFKLHSAITWSPVQSIDGGHRSDDLPARDERFATDEVGYQDENWWRYGEGVHIDPAASCPACAARPECSVPSVGLSTTLPRRVLADDQAIADKRHRRYYRRRDYHKNKVWPLDHGDVLLQRELAAAAHTQWRADRCGSDCVTLERRVPAAGLAVERVQIPLRCGLRVCDDCCKVKKSAAQARMRGDWKQFVTITIPHDSCSRLHAFRHASRWMTKLGQRMQELARKGPKQCLSWNCRNRPPHYSMKTQANTLDYAWVVEEHKDGFPHWHLVWTAEYLCYDWLRETWDDITGLGISHVHVVKINNAIGVSAYLCKYMTKAHYSADVLATCYRKRLWATTIRKEPEWSQGFQILNFTQTQKAALAKKEPTLPSRSTDTPADASGCHWSNVCHVENVLTSWSISPWWQYVKWRREFASSSIENRVRLCGGQYSPMKTLDAARECDAALSSLEKWKTIDAIARKAGELEQASKRSGDT